MRTKGLLAGAIALVASLLVFVSPPARATAPTLPAVGHIWQIQLENENESASFGAAGSYLHSLIPSGVFLPDYYATGHVSADNYIAQISGQLGNPLTLSDCQQYIDYEGAVTPQGYQLGAGCVYPATVKTLPNQLMATHKSWAGWMEDMGNDPTRETATCGQPVGSTPGAAGSSTPPGTRDNSQTATAKDQYAARHNPFVYFHSLVDGKPSPCQDFVQPLTQFGASLADPPNFNWITPNLCHDGHDSPCADGEPGGLVSANAFLQKWIPVIESSPAFQDDGMIVITFDEASPTGDQSSCCGEVPGTSGVLPVGGPAFGGGQVGALLISPLLHPHTSACAYNHFSMLRTYEQLFHISTYLGNASVANSIGPDLTATKSPC